MMEKIDFKGSRIDTHELVVLVANKVQEIVEWINKHEKIMVKERE